MFTFPLGEIPVFESCLAWAVKVDPRVRPRGEGRGGSPAGGEVGGGKEGPGGRPAPPSLTSRLPFDPLVYGRPRFLGGPQKIHTGQLSTVHSLR